MACTVRIGLNSSMLFSRALASRHPTATTDKKYSRISTRTSIMLKAATGRGVGQRPLGSTRSCARTPQLRASRPCAAGARAAPAVAPHPCSSPYIRSRLHPFGGALARARQQQQARTSNGGAAAAAASPRGDDGALRRNSGDTARDSTQASETTAAVNAAAFAAQLLPRLEGVEGEAGAMERVQRVEVSRVGKQLRRTRRDSGTAYGVCAGRQAGGQTVGLALVRSSPRVVVRHQGSHRHALTRPRRYTALACFETVGCCGITPLANHRTAPMGS